MHREKKSEMEQSIRNIKYAGKLNTDVMGV